MLAVKWQLLCLVLHVEKHLKEHENMKGSRKYLQLDFGFFLGSGENGSGKTLQLLLLMNHFCALEQLRRYLLISTVC